MCSLSCKLQNLRKSWLQSGQVEALNSNVRPFATEGRQGARARPPVFVQNSDLRQQDWQLHAAIYNYICTTYSSNTTHIYIYNIYIYIYYTE